MQRSFDLQISDLENVQELTNEEAEKIVGGGIFKKYKALIIEVGIKVGKLTLDPGDDGPCPGC